MPISTTAKATGILAVMAALGAAASAGRDNLAPANTTADVAPSRPAQPVRVTRITRTPIAETDSYTGTVRPQHEAHLGFRLPGKLIARLVEVGDRVSAGQTVARLDDTDARLQSAAAAADLAAAGTDLSRAKDDLTRNRALFAAGHVARATLDRAISAAAEAQARADRAARAHDLARNSLSYMDLVADAPGIVTATSADTGQVVATGQPVLSVATTTALDVVFALPEQQRHLVETGTAQAVLWGAEDTPYALTLRDISPDVDPLGRTYRVRMTVAAADGNLTLGRTVTVRLTAVAGPPALTLPLAAVLNDGAGAAVWRIAPGATHVERVPVTVIAMDGRVARLQGNLSSGDTIVSLGAHKIDPARPVRVVETALSPES